MSARVEAARTGLLDLQHEQPPAGWFGDASLSAVGRAIGHDGYCLFAVDPVSGVRTTMFSRHGLSCSSLRLLRNETVDEDANRYLTLVRDGTYAGVLAWTPAGGGPRSPRLHEMLRPDGYRSELRLVLVDGGRYLGGLSLFRDDPRRAFGEADVEAARAVQVPLARALCRYHLSPRLRDGAPPPAGVVLVTADDQLRMSPQAEAWLRLLEDPGDHGAAVADLERMIYELADAARCAPAPGVPVARVRAASGEWLVASASRLEDGVVAIVLRTGDVATVAPAFASWAGLTHREAEVLLLLTRGLANRAIARELSLSPLTVDDHLRSIYRKTDVRGRDELLALMR